MHFQQEVTCRSAIRRSLLSDFEPLQPLYATSAGICGSNNRAVGQRAHTCRIPQLGASIRPHKSHAGTSAHVSEFQADRQLDLAFWHCCGKREWLIRIESGNPVKIEGRGDGSPHNVVHTRVVGVVGEIESFCHKAQGTLLAQLDGSAEPHIPVVEVRADPAVARGAGRTIVGEVVVPIDIGACQQIEGMSAVIGEDGRQLKTRQKRSTPRAVHNSCQDPFMPLIEIGERSLCTQIYFIKGGVVAIEICGVVNGFAIGVICQQCEVIAEPFLDLE